MRVHLLALLFFAAGAPFLAARESDRAALDRWIDEQAAIQSLRANVEQWRSLRGLKEPISSKGSLWYVKPDLFRWQIGSPPKTIILRRGKTLQMIEPGKNRYWNMSANDSRAMMWFPLAANRKEFDQRFEVKSIASKGADCWVTVRPKAKNLRDVMKEMEFQFNKSTGNLNYFEVRFRDGSTLKNSFSNIEVNGPISSSVFVIDLRGYEEKGN